MGHGKHISAELRQLIVHNVFTLHLSLKDSYNSVFLGTHIEYTYASYKKLVQNLKKMSAKEIDEYVQGPTSRKVAGRKRKYSADTRIALVDLRLRHHTVKLETLRSIFAMHYSIPDAPIPCKATLSRIYHKAALSSKVMTLKHTLASPEAQLQFLDAIAPINPIDIIDVDESLCTADEFRQKYGWSPVGEPAYYLQIVIGGIAYSTIAAYSILGFVCWAIYEGSVTGLEMQHFLYNDLSVYIGAQSHVVLDNASIHKTQEVQTALHQIVGNRFTYCAPYSPQLKPVELGFSNVKRWLREHEQEAVQNPIHWINQAFHLYSTQGERSDAGISI